LGYGYYLVITVDGGGMEVSIDAPLVWFLVGSHSSSG